MSRLRLSHNFMKTNCSKLETPAVAGASLRFTTVVDFPKKEVPVEHRLNLHIILFKSKFYPTHL